MELSNSEYPAKLVYTDLTEFEKYLHLLEKPTHNLVWLNERIVGWATKFYRDQSRWFAIILSSFIQAQNIGWMLMEQIKLMNLCYMAGLLTMIKILKQTVSDTCHP